MKDQRRTLLNKHLKNKEWGQARKIIRVLLKEKPESHWLVAALSYTYYEQRKYTKAYEILQKALNLAPDCPMVLSDLAGTLDMLGRESEAISIFKDLIRRGSRRKTFDGCWESRRDTEWLVNDCRYRLGVIYQRLGHKNVASRYFGEHLRRRRAGPGGPPFRWVS